MTTRPQWDGPTAPRTPVRVGPYTLLTKIGEGGMGVVHLARRDETGDRVALKVLRPHIVGDDEARQRLAREVGSLWRIRSRWVAEILDADPWAPVPYVATRYVPGLSLHDHVQHEGPVTGSDLTWFAACLAEGVASVHAADVLHRDIKPSNVLMEGRTPILIDFGLARVADDPRLTHTGWLLGTPGYLAPEILYGENATAASDLHSWAATVAFAGTGNPPFGRGPAMAIMDRARRGQHDLTGLPGALHDVVAAALDPEPERRPSLEAVLAWLRPQTTRPGPVLVAPPTEAGPAVPAPDPFDAPLALAALAHGDPPTDDDPPPVTPVGPVAPDHEASTLVIPAAVDAPVVARVHDPVAPTLVERADPPPPVLRHPTYPPAPQHPVAPHQPPYLQQPYPYAVPGPAPVPVGVRVRRLVVVGAGALLTGALCAVAPWVALAVICLAVWLLRAGSLAATSAGLRQARRGRRWYDTPQLLVHAPWHLVQAIPGAGGLLAWAGGLGIAAALVCYAVAAPVGLGLFVTGLVGAISLWWGPGGSRLRGPLGRLVDPVADRLGWWLVAVGVLLALSLFTGAYVEAQGPRWLPASDAPFSTP
ncbi:protein kinase [Nocardioides sp. C4-1]|uniref:serine/threonine-protein kinase n=1 Tax=Nocardioides sp. C4-1 TaxID=3151851 RepID=UPI0032630AC7